MRLPITTQWAFALVLVLQYGIFELPSWVPAKRGCSRSGGQSEEGRGEPANIRQQQLGELIEHFWFVNALVKVPMVRTLAFMILGLLSVVGFGVVMTTHRNSMLLFTGGNHNFITFYFTVMLCVLSFLHGVTGMELMKPFLHFAGLDHTLVYFCALCAFHDLKPPTV